MITIHYPLFVCWHVYHFQGSAPVQEHFSDVLMRRGGIIRKHGAGRITFLIDTVSKVLVSSS